MRQRRSVHDNNKPSTATAAADTPGKSTAARQRMWALALVSLVLDFLRKIVAPKPKDYVSVGRGWSMWLQLMQLAWSKRLLVLLSLLMTLSRAAANLLEPYLLGKALDVAGTGGLEAMGQLQVLFVQIIGCHVVAGLCQGAKAYMANYVGAFTEAEARKKLFLVVLGSETAFFDKTHTSELDKAYAALSEVGWIVGHMMPDVASAVTKLLVSTIFLLTSSAAAGSRVVMLVLLVQVLAEKWFMTGVHIVWQSRRAMEKKVSRARGESFANIRTIKAYSREDFQASGFNSLVADKLKIDRELQLHWARRQWFNVTMVGVGLGIAWYLGLREVTQGKATLGDVTAFCWMVDKVRDALSRLLEFGRQLAEKFAQLQPAFDLLERRSSMPYKGGRQLEKESVRGAVELKAVSFAYPTRPMEPVLDSISLHLRPGSVTALCGPSGHGKSTVAKLVLRLYDPTDGVVLFDGVDVSSLDLQSFHQHTAVVSQQPALFSESIAANIKFGCRRSNVSMDEVVAAARLANAHDFILEFKQGYATEVGERGVQLSGGQRQRVAIARAILADPRLLVLDEATSALDSTSELLVQQAMERVMKGRTTLVIAHRLSTIKGADNIIVVKDGGIAEQGTHEQLLARQGHYCDLVSQQMEVVGDGDEDHKELVLAPPGKLMRALSAPARCHSPR